MTTYDDEGRGGLWPNSDKQEGDKRPNLKGKITHNGEEIKLAGWTRIDRNGKKYISLSVDKPRDGGAAPAPTQGAAPAPTADDFGMTPGTDPDDIPF